MVAGISTGCLFPKNLEDSLYDLAVNGAGAVCIAVNTRSELKKSFAHGAANLLRHFDMTCPVVSGYSAETEQLMLFSDYERRVSDILEYYKLYFNFMSILGAETFIIDGPRAGCKTELFCERYLRLCEIAKEHGVRPALRNVNHWQSGSLSFLREVRSRLGDGLSFVLDTKQAVRCRETPFAFLEAAGGSVRAVMISDSSERGDCLPIGKGRFRFHDLFARLSRLSPDCSVILDLDRSSISGTAELLTGYNILCNMISAHKKEEQT
ncbi:MAG: sugar phosphate isomerase/epimerase [Ruminococcus sp.]|nr:sugar phosphate isomerase/epimerase [Ruminococcus sp.]